MADNLAITPGTGATIAMDEVVDGTLGTVKVQYVKLMDGTLDGTSKAAVSANGVQVQQATGSNLHTVVDSGTVTTVSTVTNLSQLGGTAISMGTGVRGTGVQRVTIATDDVVPASQSGTWTVQPGNTANTTAWKVDGSAVTQPVSGSLTTVSTVTNLATIASVAPAFGSGANGATVLRTALATDSPGIIPTAVITAATAPTSGIATLGVYNSTPVAPTAGQSAAIQSASDGSQYVQPYGNTANFVSGAITTAMTSTTSTSLVAAPGAGLKNYITTIIVSNSHATVGTDIIIQDGSGGTTLLTIPAAAVYGGAVITLPTPLKQPTANTALFCANVTTGASTKVSAVGFKAV